MKLKVGLELNNAERTPGDPEADVDVMYGIKLWPSNNAAEALPKDESSRRPEIMSIRSDSMMLLAS